MTLRRPQDVARALTHNGHHPFLCMNETLWVSVWTAEVNVGNKLLCFNNQVILKPSVHFNTYCGHYYLWTVEESLTNVYEYPKMANNHLRG